MVLPTARCRVVYRTATAVPIWQLLAPQAISLRLLRVLVAAMPSPAQAVAAAIIRAASATAT